ncbi:MAG: peptidoglycan-binding protein [Eubacteriales bacterium]|nr:peptidoglycan-binding protein [Eubacteriales bacterium]
MATKITNAALIAAGKELLTYAKQTTIPYVANGMSLAGMDCQGLVEYCLIQAGVPKAECGLAGSNAHWRRCVWRGTPAECIKAFGCIPGGAAPFIWTAGHNDKYKDENGDASHMGLVWGKYTSIAASASRGQVVESNFAGKSINGGWNQIGLLPWVDYGLSNDQSTVLVTDSTDSSTQEVAASAASVDTSGFYRVHLGSKGGAVRRLQTWLSDLGYSIGVDGDFGELTEATVKQFQSDYGLEVDGDVGKATWGTLATTRQETQG